MSIKFLLDENTPYALIDSLESRGFTVMHLKKIGKGGIRNCEVYEFAEKNKMWTITRDADFQNIQKFSNHQVAGIILIKLTLSKTGSLLKTIKRFLDKYNDKLSEKFSPGKGFRYKLHDKMLPGKPDMRNTCIKEVFL